MIVLLTQHVGEGETPCRSLVKTILGSGIAVARGMLEALCLCAFAACSVAAPLTELRLVDCAIRKIRTVPTRTCRNPCTRHDDERKGQPDTHNEPRCQPPTIPRALHGHGFLPKGLKQNDATVYPITVQDARCKRPDAFQMSSMGAKIRFARVRLCGIDCTPHLFRRKKRDLVKKGYFQCTVRTSCLHGCSVSRSFSRRPLPA